MKAVLLLAAIMYCNLPAEAQRSFYASGAGSGVLQVLPQYETAENRFGGGSTPAPPRPTDSNTLEDPDFINRVASWPREKQPFWYLNSGYISNQRYVPGPQAAQPRPVSSFVRGGK